MRGQRGGAAAPAQEVQREAEAEQQDARGQREDQPRTLRQIVLLQFGFLVSSPGFKHIFGHAFPHYVQSVVCVLSDGDVAAAALSVAVTRV